MSRADAELPVLGLLHKVHGDELPLDDLLDEATRREVQRRSATHWVAQLAEHADRGDRATTYWVTRLLVEGSQRGDAKLRRSLEPLAVQLLAPFEQVAPGSTDHRSLLAAVGLLEPDRPITDDALEALANAFRGGLDIAGTAAAGQVLLTGGAAELVQMIVELATRRISCDLRFGHLPVDGVQKEVIFVEVDSCTARSYDDCRWAIDPRSWPTANPFFRSVTVLGTIQQAGPDWSGRIREEVGPGLNGKVYATILDVTYLERPGMAVTSFDLAKGVTPGEVTVDRGFLSCTDEGVHRRIRTVKVYRIEDLKLPAAWICPLWASQFALAAFWSA